MTFFDQTAKLPEPDIPPESDYCLLLYRDVALALSKVSDYEERLLPEQKEKCGTLTGARRLEFGTTRFLANVVQGRFGSQTDALTNVVKRYPVWPQALVGSISHARKLSLVACAARSQYANLGVDIESFGRIKPGLYKKLFNENELQIIDQSVDADVTATTMFSIKESIYKAVNPVTELWLGFKDVELSRENHTWQAAYVGSARKNRIVNHLSCHEVSFRGHVASLVLLPTGDDRSIAF